MLTTLRSLRDWIADVAYALRPVDPVALAAAKMRHPAGKGRDA